VPSLKAGPNEAELAAEGALYSHPNAPSKYYFRDEPVPANDLTCANFGKYDLIHKIGNGRVDVVVRELKPVDGGGWGPREVNRILSAPCTSSSDFDAD
jgi:hypothetical protein